MRLYVLLTCLGKAHQRLIKPRRTTAEPAKPTESKTAKIVSSPSDLECSETEADVRAGHRTAGRHGNKPAAAAGTKSRKTEVSLPPASAAAGSKSRDSEASLPAAVTTSKPSSHVSRDSRQPQSTCPPRVMFTGVVADTAEKVRCKAGFRHPGTYPKNLVCFLGTPT